VPPEIDQALPRHRIWGMYLAEFQAACADVTPPRDSEVALVGTHDTPLFAGWISGVDIAERVRYGLLAEAAVPDVRQDRSLATQRLADRLESRVEEPNAFFAELLEWLGRSDSPLVVPWLEDLWLEEISVNLPGTRSSVRPNWQRPMGRLLDEVFTDAEIDALVRRLDAARNARAGGSPRPHH
jgi:4-alpha-glucanotransferase